MLEWLGQKHDVQGPNMAGRLIRAAIDKALGIDGVNPIEQGGMAGTQAITDAVLANVAALPQEA
jgi:3-isopropylmalate dehydrogenase